MQPENRQMNPLNPIYLMRKTLHNYCCDIFVDVAISAPFGDQPGTVYIYVGAGNNLLNQNPIQVVNAIMLYVIAMCSRDLSCYVLSIDYSW